VEEPVGEVVDAVGAELVVETVLEAEGDTELVVETVLEAEGDTELDVETVLEAEGDTELDVEMELAVEEVKVELVDGGTEEELEAVPCWALACIDKVMYPPTSLQNVRNEA
jgi:hypothetical protein